MTALTGYKARGAFESYRLETASPLYRFFAVLAAAFNLFLLIPDIVNLGGQAVAPLVAVRGLYSAALLWTFVLTKKRKSFSRWSALATVFELAALLVFLYVFTLYPAPDFFIQLLGVMAIILMVYIVPNKWPACVCVSAVCAGSFLALAGASLPAVSLRDLLVGSAYLVFEIVVGAVFALLFLRYQYREFVTKTELERIYATDPLTQIGNRVMLGEAAQKWLARCEREGLPLCMVLMDVDNLKRINDGHGHIVGDTVLFETAQILRAYLGDDDVCVRWGGDEFVLLLPGTGAEQARQLTALIRDAVAAHEYSARLTVSCSFGIAQLRDGQSVEELIAQADRSMYAAKARGKNNIEVAGMPAGL